MPTETLYQQDPYLREFDAAVTGCVPAGERWAVTLDRSAFYPEGGGQPGDWGTLGGVAVLDTQARDGEIVHLCAGPLAPGQRVRGVLDWARRFDHMQQHSGEHIASGIICARYGCNNVGFHLGAQTTVLDFDCPIPPQDLPELQREVNRVLWENRPFLVQWPDPEALAALQYRSKKALSGPVRIVECPGADCCACCGTHVRAAGEIGLVLLRNPKPFRGGTRLELLAGRRAYEHAAAILEQNRQVSVALSVPPEATAAAVERLKTELAAADYRCVGLENAAFARQAEALAGTGDCLLFEEALHPEALRRCCTAVAQRCGGRCAVFSGNGAGGWNYAIAARDGDLRPLAARLNAVLQGRGGGKPGLVQGSVTAAREEIEAFFAASE